MNMPDLEDKAEPAAQWWPSEHYARAAGSIRQLSDETAMLRRDGHILLATASELRHPRRETHRGYLVGMLIRTTAPRPIERLPRRAFTNATSIVLAAHLHQPRNRGHGAASAKCNYRLGRTSASPPAPLATLAPGRDGDFSAADDVVPSGAEGALQRMLGPLVCVAQAPARKRTATRPATPWT